MSSSSSSAIVAGSNPPLARQEISRSKGLDYFSLTPRAAIMKGIVNHVLPQVFYNPREGDIPQPFFERIGISKHSEARSQFSGIHKLLTDRLQHPTTPAQRYALDHVTGFHQSLEAMGKTYDVREMEFFNLVNFVYQLDFTKEVSVFNAKNEIGARILDFSCKLFTIGKLLPKLKKDADLIEQRTLDCSRVAKYYGCKTLPFVMTFPHLFREGECTLSMSQPAWEADFESIETFYEGVKYSPGYFSVLKSLRDYLNNWTTTLVIVRNLLQDVVDGLNQERQIYHFYPISPILKISLDIFDMNVPRREFFKIDFKDTSPDVETFIREETAFIHINLSLEEVRLQKCGDEVIKAIELFNQHNRFLQKPHHPGAQYQRLDKMLPKLYDYYFSLHGISSELNQMIQTLTQLFFSQMDFIRYADAIDLNQTVENLNPLDFNGEIDSIAIPSLSGKQTLELSSSSLKSSRDMRSMRQFRLKCLYIFAKILNQLRDVNQNIFSAKQEMGSAIEFYERDVKQLSDLNVDIDRYGRFFPVPDKMRPQEEPDEVYDPYFPPDSSSSYIEEAQPQNTFFSGVPSASSLLGPDSPPRDEETPL
jgi:hypothetical protein